jgi:hypothetical protein
LAELAAGIEHSASRDRNMKSLKAALASLKLPIGSRLVHRFR